LKDSINCTLFLLLTFSSKINVSDIGGIVANVRVYDQLRLQSAGVSSYDDFGR